MPIVTGNQFILEVSNTPHTAQSTYVDIATLLSKKYGKTIKQGNNFQVTGIQVGLIPKNTTLQFDAGGAVSSKITYVPTTKHTRKAWNEVNKMWKAQKRLRAGIGSAVKYDEMEFRFDSSHTYARTSTLYQSGLGDSDADDLMLIGSSSESTNRLGLDDFYNSRHPVGATSAYSIGGEIKDRKYDVYFPSASTVYATSTLSAAVSEAGEFPSAYLSAAAASAPVSEFSEPLNVMCGLLKIQNYVITDDTTVQVEDEMYCQIVVHVKSWKSLTFKSKSYNRRGRANRRSKSYGRKSRYSSRRRYRRR